MDRAKLEQLRAMATEHTAIESGCGRVMDPAAWWARAILEALLAPSFQEQAEALNQPTVLGGIAPRTLHEQHFPGEPTGLIGGHPNLGLLGRAELEAKPPRPARGAPSTRGR